MPTKKYKTSNGKRVPGATTVISTSLGWGKEGLLHWAWEQGVEGKDFREERQAAADAGTIAHSLCEADVKGLRRPTKPFEATEREHENWGLAEQAYQAYLDWKEMSKMRLVVSEASFVSNNFRYGGTIDSIGEFKDGLELVDFKTSKGVYPEMLIQGASYRYLWEAEEAFPFEMGDFGVKRDQIRGMHILRFAKNGSFHHHHWDRSFLEKPWGAFLHLRALYDLKKDLEGML